MAEAIFDINAGNQDPLKTKNTAPNSIDLNNSGSTLDPKAQAALDFGAPPIPAGLDLASITGEAQPAPTPVAIGDPPEIPADVDLAAITGEAKPAPVTAPVGGPPVISADVEAGLQADLKKEKATVKTELDTAGKEAVESQKASDLMNQTIAFAADLADPNTPDPVKTAQINEFIMTFADNSAALDAQAANLRANGLGGQGAGNALLFSMMQGSGRSINKTVASMNTESAQRIVDANQWGFNQALTNRRQINTEKQQRFVNDGTRLSVAAETGNFDEVTRIAGQLGFENFDTATMQRQFEEDDTFGKAATLRNLGLYTQAAQVMSDAFPAMNIDVDGYALLDPAKKDAFDTRFANIKELPTAAERQAAMLELAAEFPQFFGFTGDDAGAKAQDFVSNLNFNDFAGIAENNKRILADITALAAQSTDAEPLDIAMAGREMYSHMTEEQIVTQFQNAKTIFDNSDADFREDIMAATNNINSVGEIDTQEEMMDFLTAKRYVDRRNDPKLMGDLVTDAFNTLQKNLDDDPETAKWFTDPKLKLITKAWIAQTVIMPNFDTEGILSFSPDAPWNDGALSAGLLQTWPSTYTEDGFLLPEAANFYQGGESISALMEEDPSNVYFTDPELVNKNEDLTNKYLKHYRENPGTDRLAWYHGTKGGTEKFDFDNVPFEIKGLSGGEEDTGLTRNEQFELDIFNSFEAELHKSKPDLNQFDKNDWAVIKDDLEIMSSIVSSIKRDGLSFDAGKIDIFSGSKVLRAGDFEKLENITADIVISDRKIQDSSAGTNGGSIITIDGVPHRITKYQTTKTDSSFGDSRESKVFATNLITNQENVLIGGSGTNLAI